MYKSKLSALRLSVLVSFVIVGLSCASYAAQASTRSNLSGGSNAQALIDRVVDANAGWDWVPRCANGAVWNANSGRCKGGSSHDDYVNRHSETSYGITNSRDLINKVQEVNVGWDWKPRCAGGAHWSWSAKRCKGGTGHEHHHHDD